MNATVWYIYEKETNAIAEAITGFSETAERIFKENYNLTDETFALTDSFENLRETSSTKKTFSIDYWELNESNNEFKAEWNDDLEGFVLTFSDGKEANTQTYTESDALHADFGDTYIERYTEYDSKLSDAQDDAVVSFVNRINSKLNKLFY